jgi:hypothetical protein
LTLSRKPLGYFQLTPPTLLSPRPRFAHLLVPDEHLKLNLSPPPTYLFQERPYPGLGWPFHLAYEVDPPDKTFLSIEKAVEIATDKEKGGDDDDDEKVHWGIDEQLDPGTFTLSLVRRNLNFFPPIKRGDFQLDIGHEPTIGGSFTFNPPGGFLAPNNMQYGPVALGVSMTALNFHFKRRGQEFLEFGLGQVGAQIDATGKVVFPFGAQLEIHNPFTDLWSKDLSVIISTTGSFAQPDPSDPDYTEQTKNHYRLHWTPIGISTIWHFD